jgi:hypothetical protein
VQGNRRSGNGAHAAAAGALIDEVVIGGMLVRN